MDCVLCGSNICFNTKILLISFVYNKNFQIINIHTMDSEWINLRFSLLVLPLEKHKNLSDLKTTSNWHSKKIQNLTGSED